MISDSPPTLIIVCGPTGVGKTALGLYLSRILDAEIISADSRQFYREMKIGTAPPSDNELQMAIHHFIGNLSIHDDYNVSKYETEALKRIEILFQTHRYALLVGGSGLYINAVCQGIDDLPDPDSSVRLYLKDLYLKDGIEILRKKLNELDPVYYKEVDRANPNRLLRALEVCISTGIPFSELRMKSPKKRNFRMIWIGLEMERSLLNTRIDKRVDRMMGEGLLEEAKQLFPFQSLNALNTVGYKELFDHMNGKMTLDQAIEKIKTHSRRFAKRQMTWFKKQKEITWFHPDDLDQIIDYIRKAVKIDN
jgi:tRNA dimethylallyltransferase